MVQFGLIYCIIANCIEFRSESRIVCDGHDTATIRTRVADAADAAAPRHF